MKPEDFSQQVLDLARSSRVPLSRKNILFYTGAPAKQAEKWLDGMVGEGVLDFDTDDEGELVYVLKDGKRPVGGPTELARCAACGKPTPKATRCTRCGQPQDPRLLALKAEVDRAGRAVSDAGAALQLLRRPGDLLAPPKEGDKSLVLAGLLGMFGPVGWTYAAPLREIAPVLLGTFLFWAFLPKWLMFLFTPLLPVSALIGVLYAWKHNRTGKRSGLLDDDSGSSKGR